jgi:lipopolysaccharide/colanic/teichoic acid biosynthesis glycosyltransferase
MHQFLLLVVDLILVLAASVAALALSDNFVVSMERLAEVAPYLLCTLAAALVAMPAFGTNRSIWRFSTMTDYLRILAATIATIACAVVLGFAFNRMNGIGRALPPLQGLTMLFVLVGARISARLRLTLAEPPARSRGVAHRERKSILVVGVGDLAILYSRSASRHAQDRIDIAGYLGEDEAQVGRRLLRHPILATVEQVAEAIRTLEVHGVFVDSVVVATEFERLSPQAQSALIELEAASNVRLEFLMEQLGLGPSRGDVIAAALADEPEQRAAFSFDAEELDAAMRRPYWRVKRAIDIVGALVLLAALAPAAAIAAVVTLLDVGRPVTFWQQRPGRNGRPFKLYKFRTMAAAHDAKGRRVPDELRVSNIGRMSRRLRFDELPQLLHILAGEMSFVGPRPLLPIDQPAAFAARLVVRPGLTGWAQVNGGRVISPADKAALDIWYVRNASLALDMEIVLRTVVLVAMGERVDLGAIHRAWRELQQAGICRIGDHAIESPARSRLLGGAAQRGAVHGV